MGIVVEPTTVKPLRVGEYLAEITEVEPDKGKFGPQLKFTYTFLAEEHNGRTLWDWCNSKWSTRSNLFKLTKAVLNRESLQGYRFDSDDLIGKRVLLTLSIFTKEDGSEFNKVESVRPYTLTSNGGSQEPPPSISEEVPF